MALAKHRRFTEDIARVYAAEILLAIEYLHKNKIIFRDLKPDNVIFDSDGHALLTDFGLSKTGMDSQAKSTSFCGSVAYLAPEMLRKQGHTKSIDWYLLGVLIYEMLVGVPPYFNTEKKKLFENIQSGPLKIPNNMSQPAKSLILLLLNRNPGKRLGSSNADAEDIKKHAFFGGIDWNAISSRQGRVLPPKIRPVISNPLSIRQFNEDEKESIQKMKEFERTEKFKTATKSSSNPFMGWSFAGDANSDDDATMV